MAGPAPPPDVSAPFSHPTEEIIELTYSPGKHWRAIVTRDMAGRYRVHQEYWNSEDWAVGGSVFWVPCDGFATFAGTLERARALAREALVGVTEPQSEDSGSDA